MHDDSQPTIVLDASDSRLDLHAVVEAGKATAKILSNMLQRAHEMQHALATPGLPTSTLPVQCILCATHATVPVASQVRSSSSPPIMKSMTRTPIYPNCRASCLPCSATGTKHIVWEGLGG